jgi:hypothetical protein
MMRIALLALLVVPPAVAQDAPEWVGARDVKGEHFVVRSNMDDKSAKQALAWAEDAYAAFRESFQGMLDFETPADGMLIYYFKSRADLDEHNRSAHGDRPGLKQVPGFFSNEDKVGHFTPDLPQGAQNTIEEIVKHETTHQIAFYAMPNQANPTTLPHFWVWEGLATYFETTQRQGKKLVTGNPNALWMKKGRDEVSKKSFVAWKDYVQFNQQQIRGKYPQAAVMVHFLMNARKGALRAKLVEYAKIVHAGTAEADTFEKVFGAKPETFEAEWASYVKGLK